MFGGETDFAWDRDGVVAHGVWAEVGRCEAKHVFEDVVPAGVEVGVDGWVEFKERTGAVGGGFLFAPGEVPLVFGVHTFFLLRLVLCMGFSVSEMGWVSQGWCMESWR